MCLILPLYFGANLKNGFIIIYFQIKIDIFPASKFARPCVQLVNQRHLGSPPKDGYIYVNDTEPSMDLSSITGELTTVNPNNRYFLNSDFRSRRSNDFCH